jgi:choline kinase
MPKCLAPAGDASLIERQIRSLRANGVDDIAVVVGYGADLVRETCGNDIDYIENQYYQQTNSLFSLWLAREFFADGFVVLNADVLFHPQLLSDLLDSRYEDALLVSYPGDASAPLGAEEMKVKIRGGRVASIGKGLDPRKADAENVGIVKFGCEGAHLLTRKLDELISAGVHRDWAPRAFRDFCLERPLYAIGTRGFPWVEIDFPEDYEHAINEILPLIELDEISGAMLAMPAVRGGRGAFARRDPERREERWGDRAMRR